MPLPKKIKQFIKLPWYKKAIYSFVILLGMILFLELAARIAFVARDGGNPYYLTFGFVADTEYQSAQGPGYSKFQPRATKHQKVRGSIINIKINSDGFRGPRDFPPKEAVFRQYGGVDRDY